jgi:glutathione S-transferase
MSELTLFADASWMSPWVFHAMVALEELRVPYRVEALDLPISEPKRSELAANAHMAKVPCLVDGAMWLTESSAISEYLAERFPPPAHPALMPTSINERAHARQVMSWLRTSLGALREARPTTSVFHRPVETPLPPKAEADAAELVRVAESWLAGKGSPGTMWCIADADLALALMRLVANSDSLPKQLVEYTLVQWDRASVRRYLAYIPTTT